MQALSLWQPWASLVYTGAKKWETRGWATHYRGPLVIHAAKRWTDDERFYLSCWEWVSALGPLVGEPLDLTTKTWNEIPESKILLGYALCVVDLVACVKTDDLTLAEVGTDEPFGNFSLGRFAWRLENLRFPFKPFLVKGHQGLFNVDIPGTE